MNKNALIFGAAGLLAGYLLATTMKTTTTPAAVGLARYSLPCECSGGGTCNSGNSDCSCCPNKYGRVTQLSATIPVQNRRAIGL